MKTMTLCNRGFMVSLCALALYTPLSSWLLPDATAQPPRAEEAGWSIAGRPIAQTGAHAWAPPPDSHRTERTAQPVPRGDLRGDIADNARRSAASRQERPAPQRSR
jgi:hypothetical protein